jgi:hypothetical protein
MLSIVSVAPAAAIPSEIVHFTAIHQCLVIPHGVPSVRMNPVSSVVDTTGMRRMYVTLLFS